MGSNFSPRKANAQILLTQIETIRSDYLSAKRSQRELQNQKEMLQSEILDKKREFEVLRTAADTQDREFLDRTEIPESKLPFQKMGFPTVQDASLALFQVSWAAFALAILVQVVLHSTTPFTAGFIVFGIEIILTFMITAVIQYQA